MTPADARRLSSRTLARGWRGFRRWRRGRPFWAGGCTLLSAAQVFASTQLSVGDVQVRIGTEGFLSYLIPLVLALCGLLIWFTPQQRLFYGVIAVAVALYSFIGVNFGGFLVGMLLGIVGGALAVAWTPVAAPDPPSTADTGATAADGPDRAEPGPVDVDAPGGASPAPGDDPDSGQPRARRTPGLLVSTLVPLILAAVAVSTAPGGLPARAAPCPPAAPSPSRSAIPDRSGTPAPDRSGSPDAGGGGAPAGQPVPPPPSPSGSDGAARGPLGGLLGGVGDAVDDLLGGAAGTPAPGAAPAPGAPVLGAPVPARSGPTGASPTPSAPAACSGPRPPARPGRLAVAAGQPPVQRTPDRMTGTRLLLEGFAFDGVVELPTVDPRVRIRTLRFSMDRSVTDDFQLRVPGPDGRTLSLRSSALTVEKASGGPGRRVSFYCSRFRGRLLGVPLTFTPDRPPPLTLPRMVFTDIDIQLVFVDSGILRAPDLVTRYLTG